MSSRNVLFSRSHAALVKRTGPSLWPIKCGNVRTGRSEEIDLTRSRLMQNVGAATPAGTGSWTLRRRAGATAGRPVLIEAGRRVDEPDAQTARFPPSSVPKVRQRIRELLSRENPTAVVCSANCGADLLLLEVAGEMHIQQHVLLPSDAETFRRSSVIDRPGDWGALYDHLLKTAKVETLKVPEGQEGYLRTNLRLFDRGEDLARLCGVPTEALVVWNQESRGPDDATEHFLKQARQRGLPVIQISTL
jgi:hypothetical protein